MRNKAIASLLVDGTLIPAGHRAVEFPRRSKCPTNDAATFGTPPCTTP